MGELLKLYRVTLQGKTSGYGTSYVVAENPDEAYKKVRKYLDDKDLCFYPERVLDKIELIADSDDMHGAEFLLHL